MDKFDDKKADVPKGTCGQEQRKGFIQLIPNKENIIYATKSLIKEGFDLAPFIDFNAIKIEIQYGYYKGEVFIFSHKDHLAKGAAMHFVNSLTHIINLKEYTESKRLGHFCGPAVAVAGVIQDGDYAKLLCAFGPDKIKLEGLEHVLVVKENGHIYHILPVKDLDEFANMEQIALIKCSLYEHSLTEKYPDKFNAAFIDWINCKNKENADRFRKTFDHCKISKFGGSDRIYSRCAILEDFFEKTKKQFNL